MSRRNNIVLVVVRHFNEELLHLMSLRSMDQEEAGENPDGH